MKARGAMSLMLVLGLLVPSGCRRKVTPPGLSELQPGVVARVDDTVITADELAGIIARQPPAVRRNLANPARKRAFLDNEVRMTLLAAEARRRGYDRDPDFQRALRQQLASTLLQREPQLEHQMDQLLVDLKKRSKVAIFEGELAKVAVDTSGADASP
jgi:hypothetical protein